METPTPFDLNEAIRRWQHELGSSPTFCADNLEELASHLRTSVQKLKATGLSEEEAFLIATQRIGERETLQQEFAKVKPAVNTSWSMLLFWSVTGIFLLRVIFSLSDSVFWFRRMNSWRYSVIWFRDGMAVFLVVVMASLFCWRWIMGRWKGFGAFIVSRVETIARTKLISTALGLVVFALMIASLPVISVALAARMNFRIDWPHFWPRFAAKVAINVILVLSMVLLARRGLRKISPTDGTLQNRATSGSR
jgi:hypothetical protein